MKYIKTNGEDLLFSSLDNIEDNNIFISTFNGWLEVDIKKIPSNKTIRFSSHEYPLNLDSIEEIGDNVTLIISSDHFTMKNLSVVGDDSQIIFTGNSATIAQQVSWIINFNENAKVETVN